MDLKDAHRQARIPFRISPSRKINVAGVVTELVAGGVGGNIASAVLKKFNLGPIGNLVAGLVGGGLGGQLLNMVLAGRGC